MSLRKALQGAGVEPDVWKIEGLDRRRDCENVVEAAQRDGRTGVGCIVLGRGSAEEDVLRWLETAARVRGFIGFAVGRTTCWDAVTAWREKQISREIAVEQIATRFRRWTEVFENASALEPRGRRDVLLDPR